MSEFKIRTYTKKELALMYFPYSQPSVAVNHMMSWVRRCTPLWEELLAMGYNVNAKCFTPRQVRAIVNQIGEP